MVYLLVACGGGIGALLRFCLVQMVGIFGGFTTFSAFSLDLLKLLDMGRFGFALAYLCRSVLGALAVVFLGFITMRAVSA